MKIVIAYIRTESAAEVMRDLYNAGVGGITSYMVHGIRSEKPTFVYSARPFGIHHLPASLKLEVVYPDQRCDEIVRFIGARRAREIAATALSPCSTSTRYSEFASSKLHHDGMPES